MQPVSRVGTWQPIGSPQFDALMRMNHELIDMAADLLDAGDYPPEVCDQLRDIWAETLVVESKLEDARQADRRWWR